MDYTYTPFCFKCENSFSASPNRLFFFPIFDVLTPKFDALHSLFTTTLLFLSLN